MKYYDLYCYIFDMKDLSVEAGDNLLSFLDGAVHRLETRSNYHFPLHCHRDFHEAVVLIKGEIRHRVEGHQVVQQEGQLLFLPAGSTHSLQSKGSLFLNIILPLFWLRDGGISLDCDEAQIIELDQSEILFLESLYQRFCGNTDDNLAHIQYFRMVLTLSEWLLSRRSHTPSTDKQEEPGWFSKAMIQLGSGDWNPQSVQELASLCNVTPEHLSRVWKGQTGRTPVQFLLDLRLDRAAQQLKLSNVTVLEVSLSAGYESPGYFSQKFKERFQLTPAQYRKKMRRYT